ncbi:MULTISPECIES: 3-isopropylmalate dehydratase small subunit [unclassified Mesobacillus]|uniref:3-isopropylmalate dehydratase small subunit n=1 Tax=unclassified Mesobacillus TaxID=2675270 RepID=UPI00203B7A0E|nr:MULTISPECIES: 3-isopropylmalate dehydratase small subunit [unclassified Mesobacillus]MCM3122913.1 3-isopropylmalate dehydratase small subunit [Mesobacillus sp. MER 33]MCM3233604.1 3-isopropylmalate dehydratase small subunit [Mesobacillus sp. MER 48]
MSEAFVIHTGKVAPLDHENIDTDAIIPRQFLKRIERTGYGQFLFHEWREQPGFVLNDPEYKDASILLTRKNFGCGSSREHAPWALTDFGFKVILAPSFADIFYNNSFKNGLLPIVLEESLIDRLFKNASEKPGYKLTVDLQEQKISDSDGVFAFFEIEAYRKELLIEGLDEIGTTLKDVEKLLEFEKQHRIFYSMV